MVGKDLLKILKESKYTTATTRVRGAERRTAEFG